MKIPSFREWLMWAQNPGIEVLVGYAISVVVEYWPRFKKLEKKWKLPVVLVFNVGIPCAAAGISVSLGYQPLDWESTFWPVVASGVMAFIGGQVNWVRAEVVRLKRLMALYLERTGLSAR